MNIMLDKKPKALFVNIDAILIVTACKRQNERKNVRKENKRAKGGKEIVRQTNKQNSSKG